MRKRIIEQGILKSLSIIKRMSGNNLLDDIKETIHIIDNLYLEINCIRWGVNGIPLSFEIYVIKSGVRIDYISFELHYDATEDIECLLNCYV